MCLGKPLPQSTVEVLYDYDWYRQTGLLDQWRSRRPGVWAYGELLPLSPQAEPVSLDEGGTPLVRLRVPGPGRLWIKDETRNPTGAFKDRFHAVSVSMACALWFTRVTAATTGNHGTSLAAYAARAGLGCLVFADPRGPEVQRRLIQLFGGRVAVIADRAAHLTWLVREGGFYPSTSMTPMPIATTYGAEGYKSIAYELFFQLSGRMPARMLVPVAMGDAIYGLWKGFRELQALGAPGTLPRMIAVQPAGCDPMVQAVREGARTVPLHPAPKTIALSIGDPIGGSHALDAVYESDGTALAVADDAMLAAMRLAGRHGLAIEPSAAAPLAAALVLQARGELRDDEDVICLATGSAIKWPDELNQAIEHHELRDDDPAMFRAWAGSFGKFER